MKIYITGANSMIGTALSNYFSDKKYSVFCLNGRKHLDLTLTTCVDELKKSLAAEKPDFLVHLASVNGNIKYNSLYPQNIYYTTSIIGLNVLNAVTETSPKTKILSVLSSCSYPEADLLKEENYWNGSPHQSVESHGFAKRTLMEFGRQIYKESNTIHIGMCINTCYGPGDSLDINKTKVIGGLIQKFLKAKYNNESEVQLWGSGRARREFIFVNDIPPIMEKILFEYNDPYYPINVGSGQDYSIKELAIAIKELVGYNGNLVWDTSMPDGQMKKLLCTDKFVNLFGEHYFTSLKSGLSTTIDYYEKLYISNNANN